jgi:hypothetical protein
MPAVSCSRSAGGTSARERRMASWEWGQVVSLWG